MRSLLTSCRQSCLALSIVALSVAAAGLSSAKAALVTAANYQTEFQGVTPATGWKYQHNTGGAIGTATNYANMLWNATGLHYNLDGGNPLPRTGGSFAFLTSNGGHPGLGTANGSAVDRWVIAAYTIQANDIAEFNISGPWQLINTSINDTDLGGGLNSLALQVYVNNTLIGGTQILPGNTAIISTFDRTLGSLIVGDTVYVAIGPNGNHGNDGFGALNFTIAFEGIPVPEPSTFALLGLGVVGLAVRTHRQRKSRS